MFSQSVSIRKVLHFHVQYKDLPVQNFIKVHGFLSPINGLYFVKAILVEEFINLMKVQLCFIRVSYSFGHARV